MRMMTFGAVIALAGLAASPAIAATMQFTSTLSAQTEVPPHPDLRGAGTLTATYDTDSKKLTYSVSYTGLTGAATAAHFHGPAAAGANAGVMVPVAGALTSPIEGSATLTDDQAKALESGLMYFNVHTAENKGGEIRGQVLQAK